MTNKEIMSGSEIVKDFIDRLEMDESLDKKTVQAIKATHASKKPTLTRLLQGLQEKRKETRSDD